MGMATDTTAPANPYLAELVELPADSLARLMKAKASELNFLTRTLRNAIRGAARQGRTFYVGRTSTQACIDADAASLPVVDFAALPDGRVFRYDGGGNAYDGRTSERVAAS